MEDNTLTEMAMLAPDSEAGAELAEDFRRIRQRIDRVVRSPIAGGTPPDGPIHAEEHTVLLPEECGATTGTRRSRAGRFCSAAARGTRSRISRSRAS